MGEMKVRTAPTITVSVTTTYLHLPARAAFHPALSADPELLVLAAREPLVPFYRFLYDAVGRGLCLARSARLVR